VRKYKCEKIFPAMLAFLLLTMLIGCSSPGPDPGELIAKAQLAISEVESYRIEMPITITQNGKTTQSTSQGEFVSPDRMHMIKTGEDGNRESIRIGQTEYDRNADSNNWEVHQIPESLPFANPAVIILEELDSLAGLVAMPDEAVDSVDCFHYKGSIDPLQDLREMVAKESNPKRKESLQQTLEMQEQMEMSVVVEVWIGKDDYLMRQHHWTLSQKFEGTAMEATAIWKFYDFNEPVEIEPPL